MAWGEELKMKNIEEEFYKIQEQHEYLKKVTGDKHFHPDPCVRAASREGEFMKWVTIGVTALALLEFIYLGYKAYDSYEKTKYQSNIEDSRIIDGR